MTHTNPSWFRIFANSFGVARAENIIYKTISPFWDFLTWRDPKLFGFIAQIKKRWLQCIFVLAQCDERDGGRVLDRGVELIICFLIHTTPCWCLCLPCQLHFPVRFVWSERNKEVWRITLKSSREQIRTRDSQQLSNAYQFKFTILWCRCWLV